MRPGRRRILGWHGSMGVWLTVSLLFLSATGLTWSTYAGANFSTLVDVAESSIPTLAAEPVPARDGALIARDWPVQSDAVAYDPYTGAVTETVLWRDFPVLAKFTRMGVLAHMGMLFGLINQVALVATALGLPCMIFWGYRMWWQRRPTRGAFRLTPPVRRGTLRALAQPASFAIIPLAVAVGWALPVLGISLVLFVAGDAAASAFAQRHAS